MAIRTKDELLEIIRNLVGEDTSDEAISFIEDVTDTLNDYETRLAGDGEDWKAKYEENDNAWRERYRSRFFSKEVEADPDETNEDEGEEKKPLTYEELFEEKEG